MPDLNTKKDIQQLLICCNEFLDEDKRKEIQSTAMIASVVNKLDKMSDIDLYAIRSQLMKSLDVLQASKNVVKNSTKTIVSDYKLVSGDGGQYMVIEFNDQNEGGKVIFTTTDKQAAEDLINQNTENNTNTVMAAPEIPNQNQPQESAPNAEVPEDNQAASAPNQKSVDTQRLQRFDEVIQQATNLADSLERTAHEQSDLDVMKELVIDSMAIRSAVDAINNAPADDAGVDELVTNLENQLPQIEEKATARINQAAPNMNELPNEEAPIDLNERQQQSQNNEPVTSAEEITDESELENGVDVIADSDESNDSPETSDIEEALDDDDIVSEDTEESELIDENIDTELVDTLSELSDLVSDPDSTKDDIKEAIDDALADAESAEEYDTVTEPESIDDESESGDSLVDYFNNIDYDKPVVNADIPGDDIDSLLESEIWKDNPMDARGVKATKPEEVEYLTKKGKVSDNPETAETVEDEKSLEHDGLKEKVAPIIDEKVKPLDGKNPVNASLTLKWKEFNDKNVLVTKQKSFKTEASKKIFASKLANRDNFYTLV